MQMRNALSRLLAVLNGNVGAARARHLFQSGGDELYCSEEGGEGGGGEEGQAGDAGRGRDEEDVWGVSRGVESRGGDHVSERNE